MMNDRGFDIAALVLGAIVGTLLGLIGLAASGAFSDATPDEPTLAPFYSTSAEPVQDVTTIIGLSEVLAEEHAEKVAIASELSRVKALATEIINNMGREISRLKSRPTVTTTDDMQAKGEYGSRPETDN